MNRYQRRMGEYISLIKGSEIHKIMGTGHGSKITVLYSDGRKQNIAGRDDGTLYDTDSGADIVTPDQIRYVREMGRLKEERRRPDEAAAED